MQEYLLELTMMALKPDSCIHHYISQFVNKLHSKTMILFARVVKLKDKPVTNILWLLHSSTDIEDIYRCARRDKLNVVLPLLNETFEELNETLPPHVFFRSIK